MAVPTKTKETSNRNKTVISRGVVGIVYNTELCISYIFKFNDNSQSFKFITFLAAWFQTENQEHFKPSIEDVTLTYKLISLKQLDIYFFLWKT